MHTFTLRFFPTQEVYQIFFEAKHTSSSLRSSLIASHLHEVHGCSFGSFATSGNLCTKLNWRLADTSTIGRVHSLASICRSCSLEVLRVEVEPQENCSVSESDCDFSRGGFGFDHNVGTSVSCMGGVDPDHCGKSELRPGHVCPSMPNTTGSYGCSHLQYVILLGLLHMRPFQWWLKSRRLHPLCNPLRPSLSIVGQALCVSSSKTLLPRPEGLPCVGVDGQLFSNLLHKLPGQAAFTSPFQAGAADLALGGGQTTVLSLSAVYFPDTQMWEQTSYRSRGWGPGNGDSTGVVDLVWQRYGWAEVGLFASEKSTHNFQFCLGRSFTPDPQFWSCGSGPWGALYCRFWSL